MLRTVATLNRTTLLIESGAFQSLVDYIRGLRHGGSGLWGVALELLLIGAVVYAALRFLQGTRGARLMKSVGLILVASFLVGRLVAEALQLDRLIFLYPYFVGGVILTTLVAFQPEIRRGLIRLGGGRWMRLWSAETDPIVEPVVNVVARLSQKKIGALIAIQRQVGLDALADSGVRIDAEVSAELLETIFWPGSVLHDMGVIIQRSRVAAAACQFPIAESGDLALSLGSRHRAALGLSHESDALIIVVSEETGTISVALTGQLHRHLTAQSLRDRLEAELNVRRPHPTKPATPDGEATQPQDQATDPSAPDSQTVVAGAKAET